MLRTVASYAARSIVVVSLLACSGIGTAQARGFSRETINTTLAVAELPREGQLTYRLILQGGPFVYEKDGTVFGNRERLLPMQRRGYYREYTVETPRARNRGARRIVCGGQRPKTPDACYYTSDHYSSFKRIVE
ncbi:ribonuclease domain-containing protein [Ottowia thiooxydans]|uniref:ribonuclease domain-containing protein n=1 Tax=Ottowia thiooxydans TaxID=219182 RepID=UPI0003F7DBAC|nr:ribonuclease [Ottowia thiooxydans]